MNFGTGFLTAINSIYYEQAAKVKVNNTMYTQLKSNMELDKDVLYPLLFVLCVQPLVQIIKTLPKISGVQTGTAEQGINLFVDDIVISFFRPNYLPKLQQPLEDFRQILVLKLNQSKSEIYSINIGADVQKTIKKRYKCKEVNKTQIQ